MGACPNEEIVIEFPEFISWLESLANPFVTPWSICWVGFPTAPAADSGETAVVVVGFRPNGENDFLSKVFGAEIVASVELVWSAVPPPSALLAPSCERLSSCLRLRLAYISSFDELVGVDDLRGSIATGAFGVGATPNVEKEAEEDVDPTWPVPYGKLFCGGAPLFSSVFMVPEDGNLDGIAGPRSSLTGLDEVLEGTGV